MKEYIYNILGILFMVLFVSCAGGIKHKENLKMNDSAWVIVPTEDFSNKQKDTVAIATFMAVGDIMVHRWQMQKAYVVSDSVFDFSPSFRYVKPVFDNADWVLGNLETTFAGKNNGRDSTVLGYSCFPYFNSPEAFAGALKYAGFDMVSTANNHTIDSYLSGVFNTLDVLDSVGIYHVGTYRNLIEKERFCLLDINGIKVGFLGCTYSLNGNSLKKENSFVVDEFRNYNEEKVERLCDKIKMIKEEGAEFVVVMVHFGTEYQKSPNKHQRSVAKAFAYSGADVILGSHPHILQPIEYLDFEIEGKKKRTLVAYSLGNFISSQVQRDSLLKDVGAIISFSVKKDAKGVALNELKVMPTYSYWRTQEIGVVPLISVYNNPKKYRFLRKRSIEQIQTSYQQTLNTLTQSFNNDYKIDSLG